MLHIGPSTSWLLGPNFFTIVVISFWQSFSCNIHNNNSCKDYLVINIHSLPSNLQILRVLATVWLVLTRLCTNIMNNNSNISRDNHPLDSSYYVPQLSSSCFALFYVPQFWWFERKYFALFYASDSCISFFAIYCFSGYLPTYFTLYFYEFKTMMTVFQRKVFLSEDFRSCD